VGLRAQMGHFLPTAIFGALAPVIPERGTAACFRSSHRKWQHIKSFPQHHHREYEDSVTESYLPQDPQEAVRAFLTFCRQIILPGETHR
jgi:hypothetical protein